MPSALAGLEDFNPAPQHINPLGPLASIPAANTQHCELKAVVMGEEVFPPWYSSFYPEDLINEGNLQDGQLYVCRSCFKYSADLVELVAHEDSCELAEQAPGKLVYDSERHSMHEVDGETDKEFCQCLSLFAKLFLDNKSIYFDVEGFYYYLLTEKTMVPTETGEQEVTRIVGFFSKEKMSWDDYNLACILIFPPFQRRGLGRILISFSYELSKLNCKVGSPEKPLSDLGRLGYTSYWTSTVARYVLDTKVRHHGAITVTHISRATCIHPEDVITALKAMGALKRRYDDGVLVISKPRIRRWKRSVRKGDLENPIDIDRIFYRRITPSADLE